MQRPWGPNALKSLRQVWLDREGQKWSLELSGENQDHTMQRLKGCV